MSLISPVRLCIAWIFLTAFSLFGQSLPEAKSDPCSYYGESLSPEIKMYPASEHAKKVIGGIIGVLGLKPNFEIREANVPNAAAVVLNSKRYILYNARFMDAIDTASGTYWAGISILAHEIGHHLNGHTLDKKGSRPNTELEADEFSGFVLNKMGATLTEAQAAMATAASERGSHTHPARAQRLNAIALGWKQAGTQKSSIQKDTRIRQETEKPAIVRRETVINENSIAFDVEFSADQNGTYFITDQGHLINVDEGELYHIGSLRESNKRGYRLMLSDRNYNYLYIASGGGIVNGSGKRVGWIRKHGL